MTTSSIGILVSTFTFKLKLESLILLGEAINTLHHFVGLTNSVKFLVQKFLLCYFLMLILMLLMCYKSASQSAGT